ncbi:MULTISPECIES: diacylglycerol kinase [unclassified Pseudoalteromonas]|jgi:diacylglycerol kinase (ATP)|uniref:diacylglycerol kinase n=1 Tax=unclassified Pseudoalteromonas TaxID=194690 RepID=UPI0010230BFA|nr:diacylglycerol kinase [Pseudoalteromonas sp. L1]RZF94735.1 diacylglycerol kinase [Pseudoalteromonas sp. CO302Y]RZG11362.1 diacylglycerol kinase [Pseudoalteromonas sp. CO133X]WOC25608.1 diacylglycerol kinase [Pseudoalteromonas sp. N1230-9]
MKEPKIPLVNKPNGIGVGRVLKATKCSIKGFKAAFKEESAFRTETYLGLVLFPLSVLLAQSLSHWLMLFIPYLLLLIVELLNSAIEALTDRVGIEYHVLSGRAKDMASAAVTLALIILLLVWAVAIYEKIMMQF